MKILCQLPIKAPRGDPGFRRYYKNLEQHYNIIKRKDTEIVIRDVPNVDWKPEWENYTGLRIFHYVEILKSVIAAEKEGFDGVSIACFADPALNEARQLLRIPVTGLAESSMHLACMMGAKFAIITRKALLNPQHEERIIKYGMESKAIKHNPVRALELPEEERVKIEERIFKGIYKKSPSLLKSFEDVANGCIDDGAEVLIMGCGLLSTVFMQDGVSEVNGAALIEPMHASLKLTEILVDMHKAKIPFVSRRSLFLPVPSKDIADALASISR